ncbi:hypothetical protein OYT1_ch2344 [Ferriphaselus amnicola]|uniref:Uncharacterized protein n=1 Tax=Ferriphaselus amnicola TaxID=1188319 RepID=A0A2Z6GEV3_9PROT|nr:hypothetical protein OYT1_ch2344 [Ferriphaselus amnicola]
MCAQNKISVPQQIFPNSAKPFFKKPTPPSIYPNYQPQIYIERIPICNINTISVRNIVTT